MTSRHIQFRPHGGDSQPLVPLHVSTSSALLEYVGDVSTDQLHAFIAAQAANAKHTTDGAKKDQPYFTCWSHNEVLEHEKFGTAPPGRFWRAGSARDLTLLPLDFDDVPEGLSLNEARQRVERAFGDLESIGFTSKSHAPNATRFAVVLPLCKHLRGDHIALFKRLVLQYVREAVGFETDRAQLSRAQQRNLPSFYKTTPPTVWRTEGQRLDPYRSMGFDGPEALDAALKLEAEIEERRREARKATRAARGFTPPPQGPFNLEAICDRIRNAPTGKSFEAARALYYVNAPESVRWEDIEAAITAAFTARVADPSTRAQRIASAKSAFEARIGDPAQTTFTRPNETIDTPLDQLGEAVVLRGYQGSGKTHRVIERWMERPEAVEFAYLVVVKSITLTKAIFGRFEKDIATAAKEGKPGGKLKVQHYNDTPGQLSLTPGTILVTTPETLVGERLGLPRNTPFALFVDEAEQCLRAIGGKTIDKRPGDDDRGFSVLSSWLARAKEVYAADADASVIYSVIKNARGVAPDEVFYSAARQGSTATLYGSAADLHSDFTRRIQRLSPGQETIAFVAQSKAEVKRVEKWLEVHRPDLERVVIYAGQKSVNIDSFLKFGGTDKHRDVVVFNAAVGTGVSIETPVDEVWGIVQHSGIGDLGWAPTDDVQLMLRCRNTDSGGWPPLRLHVAPYQSTQTTDESEILEGLLFDFKRNIYNPANSYLLDHRAEPTPWAKTKAALIADRRGMLLDGQQTVIDHLKLRGYQLRYLKKKGSEDPLAPLQADVVEDDTARVLNADAIDQVAADNIAADRVGYETEDERQDQAAAFARFAVVSRYTNTPENAEGPSPELFAGVEGGLETVARLHAMGGKSNPTTIANDLAHGIIDLAGGGIPIPEEWAEWAPPTYNAQSFVAQHELAVDEARRKGHLVSRRHNKVVLVVLGKVLHVSGILRGGRWTFDDIDLEAAANVLKRHHRQLAANGFKPKKGVESALKLALKRFGLRANKFGKGTYEIGPDVKDEDRALVVELARLRAERVQGPKAYTPHLEKGLFGSRSKNVSLYKKKRDFLTAAEPDQLELKPCFEPSSRLTPENVPSLEPSEAKS